MSLLSRATASCSSSSSSARHAVQLQRQSKLALGQQTRGAVQQKTPTVKKAQTIGGLKKGRSEKQAVKFAKERVHSSRDIPIFARMPEEKLKTPKKDDNTPAFLHPLFEPGQEHELKLPLFEPKAITPENVATVRSFDLKPTNPAKVFGLPKKMFLEFRVMSNPSSVIRDVTVSTLSKLDEAREGRSVDSRFVLSGRAGCGKSFLLHQAVQYATQKGWIVFYIPRASSLINSTTPHTYDLRTQTYLQPLASYHLLQKLLQVNRKALERVRLGGRLELSSPIPAPELKDSKRDAFDKGMTLAEVISITLKDMSYGSAPVVLEGVLRALEGQDDFPVLLAIDDFQSLFHKSAYKDPFFNRIKPFHLSVPRMVLDYASGRRGFNKGAFLASLTDSDPLYPVSLELRDALELGYKHPVSPYEKRSAELMYYLNGGGAEAGVESVQEAPAVEDVQEGAREGKEGGQQPSASEMTEGGVEGSSKPKGLQKIEVPAKFTLEEASALFEMWKDDMALSSRSYDELFLSKYVESDGNPRDFVWKGLLASLSP